MNLARIKETYSERENRIGFIPNDYQRWFTSVSTAADLDTMPNVYEYAASKTPMLRIVIRKKIIIPPKPVSVKISKGEKLFFAENDNLNLYATGETSQEAVQEFCEQLLHFYMHYKKLSWDKVTGEGRRLKEIYNQFTEINQ
jgi:hypothetical protein